MKSLNLKQITNINYHEIKDKIISHLKLIVIILSVLIVIGFGLFLYRDFYLTIISARKIVILENEVSAITINTNKINSIEQKYNKKQSLILRDWSGLNNSFYKGKNPATSAPIIIDTTNTKTKTEGSNFLKKEGISPKTSF